MAICRVEWIVYCRIRANKKPELATKRKKL